MYFLIFDESASYAIVNDESEIDNGRMLPRRMDEDSLHIPCMDENFFSIIREIDVEQIIWVAPYKYMKTNYEMMAECQITIVDPHIPIKTRRHESKYIVCMESPGSKTELYGTFIYKGMRVFTLKK